MQSVQTELLNDSRCLDALAPWHRRIVRQDFEPTRGMPDGELGTTQRAGMNSVLESGGAIRHEAKEEGCKDGGHEASDGGYQPQAQYE